MATEELYCRLLFTYFSENVTSDSVCCLSRRQIEPINIQQRKEKTKILRVSSSIPLFERSLE